MLQSGDSGWRCDITYHVVTALQNYDKKFNCRGFGPFSREKRTKLAWQEFRRHRFRITWCMKTKLKPPHSKSCIDKIIVSFIYKLRLNKTTYPWNWAFFKECFIYYFILKWLEYAFCCVIYSINISQEIFRKYFK